jgi:hypothetical protein
MMGFYNKVIRRVCMMSPFKIESDGTVGGTKVISTDTGKMVGVVQKINWSMDIQDGVSRCDLTILGMPLNAQASSFKLSYVNEVNPSVEQVVRRTVKAMREEETRVVKIIDDAKTDAEFIEHAQSVAKQEEAKSSQQGE